MDDDIQKAEPHEDDKVESARDIAVVDEDDSSCDEEEKLVSESPSVEVSSVTRDIEPGDLGAAGSPILTEQATRDIEPGDSSEVLLTDAGSKETDEETTLPPALDTTNDSSVDGALVTSDNSAGVEDSLQAATVPVVETRDAGDGEAVDKPDIDENMEDQSQPTVSERRRLQRPTSCSSCCGLFEALWRLNDR